MPQEGRGHTVAHARRGLLVQNLIFIPLIADRRNIFKTLPKPNHFFVVFYITLLPFINSIIGLFLYSKFFIK